MLHFGFDFGLFAVADGVNKQVAQRGFLEGFAKDVEDFAAKRGAFGFDFIEEALEDGAFAGIFGDEVPEVADFGLANAVDATKALFQAVWVPGQVVVDHEVGVLQVDAFAGGIGGNEDEDVFVGTEFFLDFAAVVALGAAGDGAHCFRRAQQAANAGGKVVQGVFVFGEDDEFASAAVGVFHFRRLLQQFG